jgi:hypothetical protein
MLIKGWSDRMHKDLRNIPKVHNNSEEIGGDEYKMADYSSRHPYKRLFIRYFNIR